MPLEKLLDVQNHIKDFILDIFDAKLVHLIGYGSFFMQDLEKSIAEWDKDKKPDFIAIVDDYSIYNKLGNFLEWSKADIGKNTSLNQRSVNFYNLTDGKSRFKIGIVSKRDMDYLLSEDSNDLYLSGRLSKKTHLIYSRTSEEKAELENSLENIRKKFVKIAFELQKGKFTLDDIMKTYLAISYMAEFYRYITIDRKKPAEILQKTRKAISDLLSPCINEYAEKNNLSAGFLQYGEMPNYESRRHSLYQRFARYSIAGIRHTIKNCMTNKFSNDHSSSSLNYIKRKIRKMQDN
jgi:hypothetical protein